jgi:hypothetical protein
MHPYRIVFAVAILIILVFTTAYAIVIIQDIKTGIFNWNPPREEKEIPLVLAYPDTLPITIPGTVCTVAMTLKYNGTIAEDAPLEVVNASCLGYANRNMTVSIGFSGAMSYNNRYTVFSGSGIIGASGALCAVFDYQTFTEDNTTVVIHSMSLVFENIICFPVAGDYSPIVRIEQQGKETVEYTYSQFKVHVLPASDVEAQKIGRINLGLTIAFFGFSYIGGIAIIYELLKKEKEDNQFPINIIITPENSNTFPDKKNVKTIPLDDAKPDSGEKDKPSNDNKENITTNKPKNKESSPT